jgi:hypothetical protein
MCFVRVFFTTLLISVVKSQEKFMYNFNRRMLLYYTYRFATLLAKVFNTYRFATLLAKVFNTYRFATLLAKVF